MFKRLSKDLEELSSQSRRRLVPVIEQDYRSDTITVGGRTLINLASNDYLGLGRCYSLRKQFLETTEACDIVFGSTSSRLLTGSYQAIDELEALLATSYGKEAALVFNSGYHMNVGIVSALASSHTLVIADKLVHASIIDGLRLGAQPFERFRHNDMDALERILKRKADSYEEILLIVESIYSMDGDAADLHAIVELKKKYPQLVLYVDEAHAVGVRGASGLGLAEEQGLIDQIDILCGTFGKALAGMGGYVVCSSVLRSFLVNHSRPMIFSTALPPIISAWNKFVFKQLPSFSLLRKSLADGSLSFRLSLKGKGFEMLSSSHIVPILIGEDGAAMRAAEYLTEYGYFSPAVRPPTVPQGAARLRVSLSAHMDVGRLTNLLTSSAFMDFL